MGMHQPKAWVGMAACAALAIGAAGCSCSTGTTPPDAFVARDACMPLADDPMRGHACTATSECPTGYECRASFGTGTSCEITCTPASEACLCASGLRCEVPAGMATGICS